MATTSLIPLILLALLLYKTFNTIRSFRHNLARARASGITYIVVPVFFLKRWWLASHRLFFPLLAKLPSSWTTWLDFVLPDFPFLYRHEIFKRVGADTFLTVSPGGLVLYTCEPAVITQITTRRNDFPKPTEIYRSVDVYGKNVVSTEGQVWRQHRKATSPVSTLCLFFWIYSGGFWCDTSKLGENGSVTPIIRLDSEAAV
jgi:hypothetical protein